MKTLNFKNLVCRFFAKGSIPGLFLMLGACTEDLPGVGSIEDLTPPVAAFATAASDANYLEITFTNQSSSAISYAWTFGDGTTSAEENPVHVYAGDGMYTVTLIATDGLSVTDTISNDLELIEPEDPFVAVIANGSLDDFQESAGEDRNDNRIAWRNEDLEDHADDNAFGNDQSSYELQTSTTAHTGSYAAKLPTAENSSKPQRWMYQAILVKPDTDYTISCYIKQEPGAGSVVTLAAYDAPFSDSGIIGDTDHILASQDFNEASGHATDDFEIANFSFNSGSSSEIVLFITNDWTLSTKDSESFLDDFTIIED